MSNVTCNWVFVSCIVFLDYLHKLYNSLNDFNFVFNENDFIEELFINCSKKTTHKNELLHKPRLFSGIQMKLRAS